jgi:tRNA 2-thiouridine synthesizing protein A
VTHQEIDLGDGAVRLDLLGLVCPEPITRLQEVAADRPGGTVIELEADDGGIQWDLPAWCIGQGHTLLYLEESEGVWRGAVRLGTGRISDPAVGTSPAPRD